MLSPENSTPFLQEFANAKPFDLDDFQVQACRAVEEDRGVLVCAPTGSGKTIVGEFAVALALQRGTKCFYTTPIKALSNQKYNDLVAEHGEDAVGLLTGDTSINGSAEIVVMTTEVLRNMLYAESPQLDRLTHVVMDEIHYLADRDRGAVWEEIILNLDDSVSLVGLSATVSNSEEFGEWLTAVRGDTEVIVSEHRPIPLSQYMMVGRKMFPLFEPGKDGRVNHALERAIERIEAGSSDEGRRDFEEGRGFRSRARSGRTRGQDKVRPVGRPEVVTALQGQDMLPAIVFIFSRAGCDGALFQCLRSRKELTTPEERAEIEQIIDDGIDGIPEEDLEVLNFRQVRTAWMRGFAAHHAGLLPAFKHIVEQLFVHSLVKVVFATETLALGINMPARTVVLEKMVKFNGEAHVDLTPGQYTQLTGRAGRRGIDHIGNAVVQWAPALDPHAVAGLASTRTYPLISQFQPGYNMAINMLAMNGFDDSIRLIEQSFAQFQTDRSVVGEVRDIERLQTKVRESRAKLDRDISAFAPPSDDAAAELVEYSQLRRDLGDAEKQARRDAMDNRHKETVKILGRLQVGEVIALPAKRKPELAVVVQAAGKPHDPRPWVTTERGWSGRIDAASFGNPPMVVGRIKVPRHMQSQPRRHARKVSSMLHRGHFNAPKRLRTEARTRPSKKVTALREAIRNHPVHAWPAGEREVLARTAEDIVRDERKLASIERRVDSSTDSLGRTFERIIGLLTEMDYVELVDGEPAVTDEGERLSRIHNVSDLLVAQCLKRGIWDELDPAELAGVASMLVFENRRATHGEPEAATEAMADAMNETMRIYGELVADEQRHNLPATRLPDAGFSLSMHQWTAGAPLGYALAAAAESGAELTPGDFVRWCRQVVDLLEQVKKTGYSEQIRDNANRAVDAIRRGVVAIGN
ncbi:DEAD/DEAH box helicase [Corynebacterium lujinxingii]|uniref:DEAD/DEAH box helicase n=1 Tax=Corynebacterium lujinxingii TaxID=2763010 RepID=A0A7H0JW46_9CORY|nr:DEAD/DEAH box helicase [Corynebacterium lujinxingii]MBC3178746.1 DEAD/DEAH box helicase [Corynebacterium lujinxingii]NNO11028.1 DEAD/DEAH box helicase [Corynebacterium lujinxingii]QNP89262.1 DEAD/DEAH box helicase [Corynebacterium lujinxingii]